jgi:cystathionine beta-lyase/cystathionine gamma-synthase
MRGLRTLYVRVKAQSDGAALLATLLSRHSAVAEVLYPGLANHPGHDIAARQMSGGFGGMLSIRVAGGEAAAIATAARDFARLGREPDRAPCVGGRAGHAVPARSVASLGGARGH